MMGTIPIYFCSSYRAITSAFLLAESIRVEDLSIFVVSAQILTTALGKGHTLVSAKDKATIAETSLSTGSLAASRCVQSLA